MPGLFDLEQTSIFVLFVYLSPENISPIVISFVLAFVISTVSMTCGQKASPYITYQPFHRTFLPLFIVENRLNIYYLLTWVFWAIIFHVQKPTLYQQ